MALFKRKKAQRDEEVTEISAESLAELLEDKPPHTITVVTHAKESGQLGGIAYDIAEFVSILREQTGADYVIDVQAAVGAAEPSGELTPAIGFLAERYEEEDGEDDE